MKELDEECRRVLWRCRRGMKELDLLLEQFARRHYRHAPPAQRRAFQALLALPDPQLADYLLGHAHPAQPQLARLAQRIARGYL